MPLCLRRLSLIYCELELKDGISRFLLPLLFKKCFGSDRFLRLSSLSGMNMGVSGGWLRSEIGLPLDDIESCEVRRVNKRLTKDRWGWRPKRNVFSGNRVWFPIRSLWITLSRKEEATYTQTTNEQCKLIR